ncbi:hypothetical protein THARTR1_11250 [Trichoderma harzianum]|uniref:Uncharacterized protein n=1 Tax=Trichoderma harzianum TaxID=5544 RepID=A0A2K0T467_TRIHA|nr:hypothetical protein THARTR1_11250 [Trichoderma harzianum]
MMERGVRNALDSLVQAEVTEWSQYLSRTQNGAKPLPKKSRKKPTIVDDKMSAEDWSVIAECLAILKPLKVATKRLEGRPKDGKFGAIWEVLLTMEWLLKHLEESKLQHERDEEPYLRIGCNLGWMKLDQYYTLTEDSPAYLAALILHPAFRWSTVESQWADHPDWLERGRTAVQELWDEYRVLLVEQDEIPEQPTITRKTTDLDDFMTSVRKLGTQPAPSTSVMRKELFGNIVAAINDALDEGPARSKDAAIISDKLEQGKYTDRIYGALQGSSDAAMGKAVSLKKMTWLAALRSLFEQTYGRIKHDQLIEQW